MENELAYGAGVAAFITLILVLKKRATSTNRKRRLWVRPWVSRRSQSGIHNTLVEELRLEEKKSYEKYIRMDENTFNYVLENVSPLITKQYTHLRCPISAKDRLMVTLRYLATGEALSSLQYKSRSLEVNVKDKTTEHTHSSWHFALAQTSSVMTSSTKLNMQIHTKCRGGVYPRSQITRYPVPEDKVKWNKEFKNYCPPDYTSPNIIGRPYADPDLNDTNFNPNWNSLDGSVNRVSYTGAYEIKDGRPLNPEGRTGIKGRGVLGRWGPNHAADPVVTRWKIDQEVSTIHDITKKPILQFVAIKRRDNGEWALPGGMVDAGEKVAATAVREFCEEATSSLTMTDDEKHAWNQKFMEFFSKGDEIFKGYVDDPRNTDNAWMETVAYSFHDDIGSTVGTLKLNAGDDAVGVQWIDIDSKLQLYASHYDIVKAVANKLMSHW